MMNFKELPHLLYYIYDMFFVYFLLMFFYLYEQTLPPILPFLVLVVGCGGCFFLVYFKNRDQITFVWVFFLSILTFLVGILLTVPLFYAILLSITIAWRSYVNMRETSRNDDTILFFMSFAGAFLFFLFSNSTELRQLVFLFPLVQFLLLLLCRAAVEIRKTGGPQQIKWAMSSILLLLAVSSSLFSLIIWMKEPLIKVISYTIGGVGYVIGLPIYWLTSHLPTRSTQNSLLLDGNNQVESQQENKEQLVNEQSLDLPLEFIFYSCLTISLLVLLFLLYKKRLMLSRLPVNSFATLTSEMLKTSEEKKVRQTKPPSNQIRKQLFNLEIKAMKYGVGRQRGETLSEWLRKIPGETESKNMVRDIYIKERYGEKHPDGEEALLYKQHMKNLHQELRKYALQKRKENKKK
ncbi:hypothetical protein [Bacillus sp. RAR_GA_16]|uniref:hypothetical protein n=1 Tax=Bacillus sp. RAR_GA_16 TaxID=2876774 RepID=UPI001CCA329F|nr:hypothetical protein [Bacillus sp. RAR_GA_16]MCA0171157.1 hypothetical protein [Bacillus sp. RAR_GA_16]